MISSAEDPSAALDQLPNLNPMSTGSRSLRSVPIVSIEMRITVTHRDGEQIAASSTG